MKKTLKELNLKVIERKPEFDKLEGGHYVRISNITVPTLYKLGLNAGEIAIYVYYLSLVNGYEGGTCYPSNDRLMKELGMSKAHVSRCKKKLTELGLLTLVYQGGLKWGERKANEYRVNYIIPEDRPANEVVNKSKETPNEESMEPNNELDYDKMDYSTIFDNFTIK